MTAMNTSATHAGARWLDLAQDHTATLLWTDPHSGVLARITVAMQARNAHPARTLVLLPYAQLLGQTRQLWARQRPEGFSPRFETTRSWCETLATFSPSSHDLRFDAGLDGLTARALLRQAGLAAQASLQRRHRRRKNGSQFEPGQHRVAAGAPGAGLDQSQ
jgi:ATP-dependent helicase/nuclease subunit B